MVKIVPHTPIAQILAEFEKEQQRYKDLAEKAERLVKEVLAQSKCQVHAISSRVKTKDSLEGKLRRPDKNYQSLAHLTDIVGLRVITYFDAEGVDSVFSFLSSVPVPLSRGNLTIVAKAVATGS